MEDAKNKMEDRGLDESDNIINAVIIRVCIKWKSGFSSLFSNIGDFLIP